MYFLKLILENSPAWDQILEHRMGLGECILVAES